MSVILDVTGFYASFDTVIKHAKIQSVFTIVNADWKYD